MPLPRLQQFGTGYDAFIYDIDWTTDVRRSDFTGDAYDFALRLRPGVGDHLVRLSALLRPLIERQWADLVATFNRSAVHDSGLDAFLFGEPRRAPTVLVDGLRQLQINRCFYCGATMHHSVEVDHFIPWARHPDDAIQNLVLAHRSCNSAKRDFLAAASHLAHWNDRLTRSAAASSTSSRSSTGGPAHMPPAAMWLARSTCGSRPARSSDYGSGSSSTSTAAPCSRNWRRRRPCLPTVPRSSRYRSTLTRKAGQLELTEGRRQRGGTAALRAA
jgi:hypothetical protein